jgi:hypothetical protein
MMLMSNARYECPSSNISTQLYIDIVIDEMEGNAMNIRTITDIMIFLLIGHFLLHNPNKSQIIIATMIIPNGNKHESIILANIGSSVSYLLLMKQSTDSIIDDPYAMNDIASRNTFKLSLHDKLKL